MSDTAAPSCSMNACCCPCKGQMESMGRTVRWMRVVLLVVAAFLILAVGIGIGQGQARKAARRGMAMAAMRGDRGPGPDGPRGGPMMRPGRPMVGPDGDRGRRGDGPGPN